MAGPHTLFNIRPIRARAYWCTDLLVRYMWLWLRVSNSLTVKISKKL